MSANLMSLARSGGKFLKLFGDRKMVKTMPTAKDYVQDGLIAMWDGIENAGWGMHDPSATVWKDLSMNGNNVALYAASSPTWADNSIVCPSRTSGCVAYLDYTFDNVLTIECVFDGLDVGGATGVLLAFGSGRQCLAFDYRGSTRSIALMNLTTEDKIAVDRSSMTLGVNVVQATYSDITTPYSGRLNGSVSENTKTFGNGISGNQFVIGCRSKTQTLGYIGRIYSIRLYDRALSASELDANYAIDKARFNLPD